MKRLSVSSIRGWIDAGGRGLLINQRGEFIYRWKLFGTVNHIGRMTYHPVNMIYHNCVILDLWGMTVYNIGEI